MKLVQLYGQEMREQRVNHGGDVSLDLSDGMDEMVSENETSLKHHHDADAEETTTQSVTYPKELKGKLENKQAAKFGAKKRDRAYSDAEILKDGMNLIAQAIITASNNFIESQHRFRVPPAVLLQHLKDLGLQNPIRSRVYVVLLKEPQLVAGLVGLEDIEDRQAVLEAIIYRCKIA